MNDLAKQLLENNGDFRGSGKAEPFEPVRQTSNIDSPYSTAASDAEEELEVVLDEFESQIEDISNIVFEMAGEIHGRVQCDANVIHEAILNRVKEQVLR